MTALKLMHNLLGYMITPGQPWIYNKAQQLYRLRLKISILLFVKSVHSLFLALQDVNNAQIVSALHIQYTNNDLTNIEP